MLFIHTNFHSNKKFSNIFVKQLNHSTFDINCASNLIITYSKSKRLKGKSPQEWTKAFKDAKQWAQEVSQVN